MMAHVTMQISYFELMSRFFRLSSGTTKNKAINSKVPFVSILDRRARFVCGGKEPYKHLTNSFATTPRNFEAKFMCNFEIEAYVKICRKLYSHHYLQRIFQTKRCDFGAFG